MFKQSDDDDDTFFAPIASSKLASLFGETMAAPELDNNKSLIYTAPKQPQSPKIPPQKTDTSPKASSLIIAKVVHTFKLENGSYSPIGKLGLALVGNKSTKFYQLILYRGKADHIVNIKLTPKFELMIQKNNYVTFYDDRLQSWSILFENDNDLREFIEKYEECDISKITNLNIPQPATSPKLIVESKSIDTDKITSSANSNVQSSPKNLPIPNISENVQSDGSETKSKAEILSRMAKMGQPILLPNRAESIVTSDVTDSDTESDYKKHKAVKKPPKKLISSEQPIANLAAATGVQASTANILPSPSHLQQYAFVNGQFVPIGSAIAQPLPQSPLTNLPMSQPIGLPVTQAQFINPGVVSSQQLVSFDPLSHQLIAPPAPALSSESMNVFFAENRIHNSEVRMHMLKMNDKVEKILEKIANAPVNNSSGILQNGNDEIMRKQIDDLAKRLELLKTENIELKLQIKTNSECATSNTFENCVNEKCKKLELELSNKIKQKEEEISELLIKIKKFEDNFVHKEHLNKQKKIIDDLELEKVTYLKKIADFEDRDKSKQDQLYKYKEKIEKYEKENLMLETSNEEKKRNEESKDEMIENLNEQIKKLQNETQILSKNKKCDFDEDTIDQEVKMIMNTLYSQLTDRIEDEEQKTKIASAVIQSTSKIMSKLKYIFTNSNTEKNNDSTQQGNSPPPVPQFDV